MNLFSGDVLAAQQTLLQLSQNKHVQLQHKPFATTQTHAGITCQCQAHVLQYCSLTDVCSMLMCSKATAQEFVACYIDMWGLKKSKRLLTPFLIRRTLHNISKCIHALSVWSVHKNAIQIVFSRLGLRTYSRECCCCGQNNATVHIQCYDKKQRIICKYCKLKHMRWYKLSDNPRAWTLTSKHTTLYWNHKT